MRSWSLRENCLLLYRLAPGFYQDVQGRCTVLDPHSCCQPLVRYYLTREEWRARVLRPRQAYERLVGRRADMSAFTPPFLLTSRTGFRFLPGIWCFRNTIVDLSDQGVLGALGRWYGLRVGE